jgi:hypothetical protein
MMSVAQGSNQRDDIEAELALGQSESALLLGSARLLVEFALRVDAAADHQSQAHQSFKGGDGTDVVVSDPELPLASSTEIA